ncbi:MAG: helix-turn-helix domain-containing protein [Spirochaetota bacterium]
MYGKMQEQERATPLLENFGQDPGSVHAFALSGIWSEEQPEHLGYHSFHQVFTVGQGVFLLYDGVFQQPLYRGSAAFIPAMVPHRVFSLQEDIEAETTSIYFEDTYFPGAGNTITIFPASELATALIGDLAGHELTSFADAFSLQCVETLARVISRDWSQQAQRLRLPVSDDERIEDAVLYIQKNCQQKITLEEIADSVSISSRQLSRLFSTAMGITPFEYVRMYRILQALPDITDTNKSIVESIYTSGYETVSSFYRDFTFFLGMPPGSFRKSCL